MVYSDSTEGNIKNGDEEETIATCMPEYVMMQLSLKKGLDVFGKNDKDTKKKEMKQMYLLKAFTSIDGNQLTEKGKSNAILSLMFLIKKRGGTIKA